MRLSDYTVTEAGFGADLGAEKFLDIKCRMAGLKPNCVVLVATVRALKYNGGVPKAETGNENLEALEKGLPNLLKHVSNITNVYKLPCVVAINRFPGLPKVPMAAPSPTTRPNWALRKALSADRRGRAWTNGKISGLF